MSSEAPSPEQVVLAAREFPGLCCLDLGPGRSLLTWGDGPPLSSLDCWQDEARRMLRARPAGPGFSGGLVGWIGYEAGRSVERMPAPRISPDLPELCLWRVEGGMLWTGRSWSVDGAPDFRERALDLLDCARGLAVTPRRPGQHLPLQGPRERYEASVATLLDHIRRGDVYQANLAWRVDGPPLADPVDLWLRLRHSNPAERGAFLRQGPASVVSNSPELFLEVDPGGGLRSVPIKGTASLAAGPQALLHSDKERAELTMIVDLVRNDLGRVARPGSVVAAERTLRRCGDLWHAEQEVSACLVDGADALHAIAASFPPGSVTGAPKVRAMELIHDLEPAPRGIYTGAIGYLSDDGSAHFNVAIRTVTCLPDRSHFHVGAGIVADSLPGSEWQETLAKGHALQAALS